MLSRLFILVQVDVSSFDENSIEILKFEWCLCATSDCGAYVLRQIVVPMCFMWCFGEKIMPGPLNAGNY
jgi:hypothetical protein